MEDKTLYNQITVKNIDNEDFVFKVNREQYLIRAGETRIFMKFMVRPLLKHLVDRILIKRDPEGKLLRNQKLRDELAAKIVLHEQEYERPRALSDSEMVDQLNSQPELDRLLSKHKERLTEDPTNLIPAPDPEDVPVVTPPGMSAKQMLVPSIEPEAQTKVDEPEEKFDQVEEEKAAKENRPIPSREQMLSYAKNTLKLDPSEPKTKKVWDQMTDAKLYKELGLDQEENLSESGFN